MTRTRDAGALLARDHDVRGLDVAVDDAARVAVLERVGDLDPDVHDLAEVQRLVPDQPQQVRALRDGHHEEERALVTPEVVDRHDRGVVHLGDELRLALEALLDLGRQVRRGDELDRDLAVEQRVARAVDDAHAAAAELPEDLVAVGELGADQSGSSVGESPEFSRYDSGHAGLREARRRSTSARSYDLAKKTRERRPAPLRLAGPRHARRVRRHDRQRQDRALPVADRGGRDRRRPGDRDRSEGRPLQPAARRFPTLRPRTSARGSTRRTRRARGCRRTTSRSSRPRPGRRASPSGARTARASGG